MSLSGHILEQKEEGAIFPYKRKTRQKNSKNAQNDAKIVKIFYHFLKRALSSMRLSHTL